MVCAFKSEVVYFCKYHNNKFTLLDDNYEIKMYRQARTGGEFEEIKTLIFREEDVEQYLVSGKIDFEKDQVEISDTCLYWKNEAIVFHERLLYGKDKNFFEPQSILDQDSVTYGPVKVYNPSYNYYIVKNYSPIEEYELPNEAELLAAEENENKEEVKDVLDVPYTDPSLIQKITKEKCLKKVNILTKYVNTDGYYTF